MLALLALRDSCRNESVSEVGGGLFDLLGIVQQSIQGDQKWASPSTAATGYIFAGVIFWAFCFAISRYSARLERSLNTSR